MDLYLFSDLECGRRLLLLKTNNSYGGFCFVGIEI